MGAVATTTERGSLLGEAGYAFLVWPVLGRVAKARAREARQAIGNQSPGQAANDAAVSSAAVGTGLGALAGAAIGSMSGNVGAGAAIGAGTGLVAGGVVGSNRANQAGGSLQARYDTVYAQCMTASGNLVAAPPPPPVVVYERPEPVYVERYYGPRYYRRW